jgi:TonB family protein
MQNKSPIKIALSISILIHVLFIGLVKNGLIIEPIRVNKIIAIEYYKEKISEKVPAKKPAKKIKKVKDTPPPETKKKIETKPKKEEVVIKKQIVKPKELKKENVKKVSASKEKKIIKEKHKIKDLKKLVIDDEKAKEEKEIKTVEKVEDKSGSASEDGTIDIDKKTKLEKSPVLLKESVSEGSLGKKEKAKDSDKGDVRIARIIPSIERLEELNKIEAESTRGFGDKEVESVYLDSTNVKYVSYLDHIKLAIELAWNYPEAAARRGIEGEGVLSFTIDSKGKLADIRLLSTTGSKILDERFVRAVKMASPFPQIPKNYKTKKLNIIATYKYVLSIVYKIK